MSDPKTSNPKTLYDKIWDAHLVHEAPDGTCLLYIDRHLVHEVTSPQAFEGLRMAGRQVRAQPCGVRARGDRQRVLFRHQEGADAGGVAALRQRLEALPAAARAELIHVLMRPDFDRADAIGSFWGSPRTRIRRASDRLRGGPGASGGARRHVARGGSGTRGEYGVQDRLAEANRRLEGILLTTHLRD